MNPKPCPFCDARAQSRRFTVADVYACANAECQASTAWMTLDQWNHRPEEARLLLSALENEMLETRNRDLEHWIKQTSQRIRLCAREIIGDHCECGFCDNLKEGQ